MTHFRPFSMRKATKALTSKDSLPKHKFFFSYKNDNLTVVYLEAFIIENLEIIIIGRRGFGRVLFSRNPYSLGMEIAPFY